MTRIMLPAPMPLFSTVGREFTEAQNRLRRFFGNEFGLDALPMTEPVGWVPKVEIMETEAELLLTVELPGMTTENIDISFEDDVLTIRGEKKEEKKEAKEEKNGGPKYHLWERTYGAFIRSFTLPLTIDPAKIVAELKDGILKIRMPKVETAKVTGRKIEIATK